MACRNITDTEQHATAVNKITVQMPTRTYVIVSYESNNKTLDFTVHVLFESTRVLDPYL